MFNIVILSYSDKNLLLRIQNIDNLRRNYFTRIYSASRKDNNIVFIDACQIMEIKVYQLQFRYKLSVNIILLFVACVSLPPMEIIFVNDSLVSTGSSS